MVRICRLCASLRKDDQLRTIKDKNDDIWQKLQKCCHVHIHLEDTLPKCVCHDCLMKLDQAFAFYNRVHEAQEALAVTFQAQTVDDNMPGKSKQTCIPIGLRSVEKDPYIQIEPMNIKAENYNSDPLQNAIIIDNVEEPLVLEQDSKEHENENLLIENIMDERNHQSMNAVMNGFRKRNTSHDWQHNEVTENIDRFESIDVMPAKRSREINFNPTEEIIGMLKTVLKDQKRMESRIAVLEQMVEENVMDKSIKMTLTQATINSKVKVNKDSHSKMHIEIANLLPLTSIDKINDLEEKLQNKIYAEEMITYLYRLKGVNGELDGVFRRLFSDDVLHLFNWDGRSTKKALHNLRLANDFLFDVFREDGRIQFEKDIRKCIELSHNRIKQKIYKKRNSLLIQEN